MTNLFFQERLFFISKKKLNGILLIHKNRIRSNKWTKRVEAVDILWKIILQMTQRTFSMAIFLLTSVLFIEKLLETSVFNEDK